MATGLLKAWPYRGNLPEKHRSMFDIGIIPAAGAGMRLYPYTENTPKALFEIGGKSLLLRNIEIMRDQLQVRTVIIITGHLGEQVRMALGDGASLGIRIEYIHCTDIAAGLAKGLCLVRERVRGNFPVILGDELYLNSNHRDLLQWDGRDYSAVCGIKITGDTTLIRQNYAVRMDDSRILALQEKPEVIENNYLGCGTYLFTPAIFDAIDATPPSARTGRIELTDVINRLAQETGKVHGTFLSGGYRNINSPDDYNSAAYLYRREHFHEYRTSLVIPAYNEAASIGHVIEEFTGLVDEIIVAENCSSDGTARIAADKGARVFSQPFAGYGAALRHGMDQASGDILVLMEADASFTPDDLPKILEYMKDADMVIGTRTTKQMIQQGANMDAFLRWGNVLAAKVLQALWLRQEPRFTDLGCTYRGIWKEAYRTIRGNLNADGPEFSPEMMVEILRAQRKIIEIPVSYHPRIGGASKHSGNAWQVLKTGYRMLRLILRRRLNLR